MFLTNATVTVGQLQQMANMASANVMGQITTAFYTILSIVGFWILFELKNESGWKAIIPIYSTYIAYKLFFKKSKFWTLVICWVLFFMATMFLAFVGLATYGKTTISNFMGFGGIISFVVMAITLLIIVIVSIQFDIAICKKYNMGLLFTLGMIFVTPIFLCILAYEIKKGRAVESN